jgi:hypothetical protein
MYNIDDRDLVVYTLCRVKTICIAAILWSGSIVPVSCFGPLASLVLCFSSPIAKVRLEAIEMRGMWRLPHHLDRDEGDVRDDVMMSGEM